MVGDGTSAKSRTRARWRRWRPWVVMGAIVLVGAVIMILPQPANSGDPYALDNPSANGSQALGRILERHGVRITVVHSASEALEKAHAGDTLAVVGDRLDPPEARRLSQTTADLVAVDVGWTLSNLVPGVHASSGSFSTEKRSASCADPDAQAAGTITAVYLVRADDDVEATTCFPERSPYGWTGAGTYLTLESNGRRTAVMAGGETVVNSSLAHEGNAALALRALGRHKHLVWYVAKPSSNQTTNAELGLYDVLPPWLPMVGLQALVLLFVAALWRGRRLGPVVTEPLPVVVPAAEASRGRARLYRKMGARGRAAAALRAGTARRLGVRLGLPRSAGPTEMVDAVARASQRPPLSVEALLYGLPPVDDRGLVSLAQELDRLESEVHHP